MHIFQNQDLKNVVLAVGIKAVGFFCAWVKLHTQNGFAVDVNIF